MKVRLEGNMTWGQLDLRGLRGKVYGNSGVVLTPHEAAERMAHMRDRLALEVI